MMEGKGCNVPAQPAGDRVKFNTLILWLYIQPFDSPIPRLKFSTLQKWGKFLA